jgi:hypothetical protein
VVVSVDDAALVDGAVVEGVVVEVPVDDVVPVDGAVVVEVPVDDVVPVDGAVVVEVPVDDVVLVDGAAVVVDEPVVVAEPVGVVVLADAMPGATRAAATARARAAAGRTLRMEWCMVPLLSERCRDGGTGTRWKRQSPRWRSRDNRGRPRTWVSGLRPAYLDGNGAAPRSRHSGSPPSRAAYGCGSAPDSDRLPLWRVVVSPEGDGLTLHPRRRPAGNPDERFVTAR